MYPPAALVVIIIALSVVVVAQSVVMLVVMLYLRKQQHKLGASNKMQLRSDRERSSGNTGSHLYDTFRGSRIYDDVAAPGDKKPAPIRDSREYVNVQMYDDVAENVKQMPEEPHIYDIVK